jgi:hypothetical protein
VRRLNFIGLTWRAVTLVLLSQYLVRKTSSPRLWNFHGSHGAHLKANHNHEWGIRISTEH